MILSTDDNFLKIGNGQVDNSITVKMCTACDCSYTDFLITIPKDAEISRGKTQLKNNGEPYKIRVYNQPLDSDG